MQRGTPKTGHSVAVHVGQQRGRLAQRFASHLGLAGGLLQHAHPLVELSLESVPQEDDRVGQLHSDHSILLLVHPGECLDLVQVDFVNKRTHLGHAHRLARRLFEARQVVGGEYEEALLPAVEEEAILLLLPEDALLDRGRLGHEGDVGDRWQRGQCHRRRFYRGRHLAAWAKRWGSLERCAVYG